MGWLARTAYHGYSERPRGSGNGTATGRPMSTPPAAGNLAIWRGQLVRVARDLGGGRFEVEIGGRTLVVGAHELRGA